MLSNARTFFKDQGKYYAAVPRTIKHIHEMGRPVYLSVALFFIYFFIISSIALGLAPAVAFFSYASEAVVISFKPLYYMYMALLFATSYFVYGFSLLIAVPLLNFICPFKMKPYRGSYYGLGSMPWFFHNMFTYVVRYTFLEFVTPSVFNNAFYRAMGMKVGHGASINSVNISDPSMLELGRGSVIGGSASVICHYAASGFLIVAPVKIGNKATIGMKATIMGDVHIGDGARVLPNSVVMPKTRIPAGEIWGGVPAVFIDKTRKAKKQEETTH